VLILGFIVTIVYGALGPGVAMIGDTGHIVNPDNPIESPHFREPGVYQTSANTYSVYVLAQRFSFRPGTGTPIRIPADTKITFYITSPDVVHGFEVVGTNVNVMVIPGQISKITVRFDDPGTYHIICNEYCGAAHHAMEGTIIVVPQNQFTNQSTGGDLQWLM
ncbi:MAG: cytochrome c oxidase subunit II, partial [Halobacteriaceae archaeon]